MGAAALIAAIANALSVLLEANQAIASAVGQLKQAQDEGWAEDDPRWADAFAAADGALKKALDRLT